jgi:protein-tyrosine phosphatase
LLGLHYRNVYILDLPEEPLSCHFIQCFEFIDEALKSGRVLVHCNAGISRSVSIVIAFLMSRRQKSLCEAMAQVKAARPRAQPNVGFVEQLKMYESNILNNHDVSSSKPNS